MQECGRRPLWTLGAAARLCLAAACLSFAVARARAAAKVRVVWSADGDVREGLAAREIRRYLYVRTGQLALLGRSSTLPSDADAIVVAVKERSIAAEAADASLKRALQALKPQEYLLRTVRRQGRRIVLIAGGDSVGALYGAYRFAERLGVRFFLHGDVVPDERIPLALPDLDETGRPLFALRGLNPWGSHPFGFDLWNADDWQAHIGQLAKMRMNFVGIHCYPEGRPYAEPTVWVGLPGDFDGRGRVTFSYPSRYYNTLWRGRWGPMLPRKTSDYAFGAALLFDRDDWGPDVQRGHCPSPASPEACNEVFNRAGALFREAFGFARLVGVKTCLGTEAPLLMPRLLRERLKRQGKDPADPAAVREVYEGIFRRIMKTHPLDYYWLWTPEGWTWRGNSAAQLAATAADVRLALAALKNAGAPFKLATCGWVLGPKADRAAFDRHLPSDVALSAISRRVGHEPIDPAFGRVARRAKWAIPWMEDDAALASPQLWVGRTRKDAADALAYGCTGLMGLQWRTRIIGPNIAALAQAAWDQTAEGRAASREPRAESQESSKLEARRSRLGPRPVGAEGPLGGKAARYPGRPIANTTDDPLYQTCRYDLRGYRLTAPNGTYRVVLKFCEPHFNDAGKRVFDVTLQGRKVVEKLDILARVGKSAALDFAFDGVAVDDGWLRIGTVARISLPCISAIAVEGERFKKKINCGGAGYADYAADWPASGKATRGLPTDDFFADWARALFGPEAADDIASIFERIDGRLPRPAARGCPCGLAPNTRPWEEVAGEYAFVDALAKCRTRIRGAGSLDRFDYWLNTLRTLRSQARVGCAWGRFNGAMAKVGREKSSARRRAVASEVALPAYRALVGAFGEAYRLLLATVSTNGGLATAINWEHNARFRHAALARPGEQLARALGTPLPPDVRPPNHYAGPPRLIVPTVRTSVVSGGPLALEGIILASSPPAPLPPPVNGGTEGGPALHWRPMGEGAFRSVPLKHVGRAVYLATFPAAATRADLEYYLEATLAGRPLRFPATAPTMNQTIVVIPPEGEQGH